LRILFIISSLAPGGAEVLVRNLAIMMAGRGQKVMVAYISSARDGGTDSEYEQYFLDMLKNHGVEVFELGHDCRTLPWQGAQQLRRIVDRFNPDLMHIHLGYGLLFQALGRIRVPTIFTLHNIRLSFPRSLFRVFDTFIDRNVAICAPCEAVLRRCSRRPLARIANGSPVEAGRSVAPRQYPQLGVTVLSVGALIAQKGYRTLIQAAACVVQQFDDRRMPIQFLIAGDGPKRKSLQAEIGRRGLEGRVVLLGARVDVSEVMARSDLLVMSSRYEGLPVALIEGHRAGLPVVATDVGGCNEIVRQGVSGRLVPPGAPDMLADAIVWALADPKRYEMMSRQALAAGEAFDIEKCVDRHLAVYQEVCAEYHPQFVVSQESA